jgi:hypothetical protein
MWTQSGIEHMTISARVQHSNPLTNLRSVASHICITQFARFQYKITFLITILK